MHLPSNGRHSKKCTDAAEHKCDNTLSREASRQGRDHLVLTLQVEHVDRVAGGVTCNWYTICLANCEMVIRDGKSLLQLKRRFNYGGRQSTSQMPICVSKMNESADVSNMNTIVSKNYQCGNGRAKRLGYQP